MVPGRDEPPLVAGDARQAALAVATAKMPTRRADDRPLLAADTVVALGSRLFGKPRDRQDAEAMLWALSGRRHEVVTAVALRYGAADAHFAVCSEVTFRKLSVPTVAHYLDSGEYLDKAGAYGIQGLGVSLVESVLGSYSNVVGLPVTEVLTALRAYGYEP